VSVGWQTRTEVSGCGCRLTERRDTEGRLVDVDQLVCAAHTAEQVATLPPGLAMRTVTTFQRDPPPGDSEAEGTDSTPQRS
jgi:hypothetical protein